MSPSNTFLALLGVTLISQVLGHSYMTNPPGRSSAWRFGFGTAHNYNDNEVNCGRVALEDCGVCGDPLSQNPGDNTLGGRYGSGIIVETYKEGDIINTVTRVTANHMGWYEFSLCEIKDGKPAVESCFKPLEQLDAERHPKGFKNPTTKWELLKADGAGDFTIKLQLPKGFTCDHCVLRSLWNAGNDWGCDADGTCGMGHGPTQEKFYACSDIAITSSGSNVGSTKPPATTASTTTTTKATNTGSSSTAAPSTTTTTGVPVPPEMSVCKGAGHGEVRHDPNNCCGFVYCMWPGTPSQAIIAKKCPTSLAFNVEAKQCDWAEAVKCGDRSALCLLRK